MDKLPLAPGAVRAPHLAHCPPWCVDCRHYDTEPHRALLHRGPAETVPVYDEGCALVEAYVRTAFWDKAPGWLGTDPADLERPYVEVTVPTDSALLLSLSRTRPALSPPRSYAPPTPPTGHTPQPLPSDRTAARLDLAAGGVPA